MPFEESYLGRLRKTVGPALVLIPGAIVVVVDDNGAVLLGERGDTGLWGLPAGHAEADSSFLSTAVTELREEAGLVAAEADLVPFGSISKAEYQHYSYPNGHEIHSFALCFALRRWTGSLQPDGQEILQTRFFERDKIPEVTRVSGYALTLFDQYTKTGQFQVH